MIGKINQKLIFNRRSKDALRSGTNGNISAYSIFKLLIDKNPNDEFYVMGDNDLDTLNEIPENVIDAKDATLKEIKKFNIDHGIIMAGLPPEGQSLKTDKVIQILNKYDKIGWVLISDDPRCLDSLSNNKDLKSYPDEIITQFMADYKFKDRHYGTKYIPVETAVNYVLKIREMKQKDFIMVAISNSVKDYNRTEILYNLLGRSFIPIIGRLSTKDKLKYPFHCHLGEVEYSRAQDLLERSVSTLIIPVRAGCVTSKYVEALSNNCLPIFYKSYGHELLGRIPEELIVSSSEDLKQLHMNIVHNQERYISMMRELQNQLIKPYESGEKLSKQIMSYVASKGGTDVI
jgi:hypothetical protein